jgi:Ca2+-transporting ATPase
MEPAKPGIDLERPRDRDEPLLSRRDLKGLFAESAVLAGGGLAALAYGVARYGPGVRAATLAYQTLATGKVVHALTCRPLSTGSGPFSPPPANPLLKTILSVLLAAQIGVQLLPGVRGLLNVAPLTALDIATVGFTAWSTHLLNRSMRKTRQGVSTPEGPTSL